MIANFGQIGWQNHLFESVAIIKSTITNGCHCRWNNHPFEFRVSHKGPFINGCDVIGLTFMVDSRRNDNCANVSSFFRRWSVIGKHNQVLIGHCYTFPVFVEVVAQSTFIEVVGKAYEGH